MQAPTPFAKTSSQPTPIAPELLKLIGGGAASVAPQAPRNTWA